MKTQETIFTILKKEGKTYTTNDGKKLEFKEYTIREEIEREDGSISETTLTTSAAGSLQDFLQQGAKYKGVIYISSRKTEKDGKTSYWPAFRITRAEKIGEVPAISTSVTTAQTDVSNIGDEIPFNNVR